MPRASTDFPDKLVLKVIRGDVFGVTVFRGFARLCDLAALSRPDIYDARSNPTGTQRDLSAKHAKDAYEYIRSRDMGFWPEVFLCARDDKVFKYRGSTKDKDVGILTLDLKRALAAKKILVSRVDGNHRLHLADGSQPDFPPILKTVSFCLAYGLALEQEMILFRDINANQKAMNTSHLDNIEARLTPEDHLKRTEPDLFIARQLGRDETSPLFGRVYEGGKRPPGAHIPLRTLRTGIGYMLSRPTKLTALREADAQYKVIRNYFSALRDWQPQAWVEPGKYLLLRGAGLWAACFIGAEVIDRALGQAKFGASDMLGILKSGRAWDWSNKGDFAGLSGRGGAVQISNKVSSDLHVEGGISVKSLYEKIMARG